MVGVGPGEWPEHPGGDPAGAPHHQRGGDIHTVQHHQPGLQVIQPRDCCSVSRQIWKPLLRSRSVFGRPSSR